jgi:hypothetical protein
MTQISPEEIFMQENQSIKRAYEDGAADAPQWCGELV